MKKIVFIILAIILITGGILLYIYIDTHRPKQFSVTFFNIGQGDSALIKFDNGQKMLVDCGADRKILAKLGKALPFYDRTIDYVLATHPDLDHYGGCVDVLKRYEVKNIIINGKEKTYDPYWQEWNGSLHAEPGANAITMTSPTVWTIGSNTLEFISPDPALSLDVGVDDSNNYSIVFKLTHVSSTFLFTGDMEEPLENELMRKYCSQIVIPAQAGIQGNGGWIPGQARNDSECPILRANTLKVGHHGSDSGTGEAFLSLVHPEQAVISAGKNRYGHPSRRVLKRLERIGAEILQTDKSGDIIIK